MVRFGIALVFVCLFSCGVFGGGTYDGGDGTEGNPYQIATAGQLHELSLHNDDWGKCFVLTGDIDMDPGVTGIGKYSQSLIGYRNDPNRPYKIAFNGIFDGKGHVISNLIIEETEVDNLALFGYISQGEVKNLGLVNITVKGEDYTAGLVSSNHGTISNCFVKGQVSGGYSCGVFAGQNSGVIRRCFSSGSLTVVNSGGGFVGLNSDWNYDSYAVIEDCYSTATVTFTGDYCDSLGGFAGENNDVINRCYSSGSVIYTEGYSPRVGGFVGAYPENCNGCFWDFDSSGQLSGSGIYRFIPIGLDTKHMKSMLFFSYFSWDGGVWTIDDGNDYPRLAWEEKTGVPISSYSNDLTGSGTLADPYEIESAEDLRLISCDNTFWDKYFVLVEDIDMDGVYMTPLGRNYWDPFKGSFDGGGHVISNLSDGVDNGLFGYIGAGSEVKRLGLKDINIFGFGSVGGLASYNEGTVSQCYVTGEVISYDNYYCGGLIGKNDGIIRDCYSRANVTGFGDTGGLIGTGLGVEISRCYSVGIVTADTNAAGGFIGGPNYGLIVNLNSCFWDYSIYGMLPYEWGASDGYLSRNTYAMQNPGTYNYSGWGGDVWTLDVGNDYPRLSWENAEGVAIEKPGGDGSAESPYEINTAFELLEMRAHSDFFDKHFRLTSDIDMSFEVTGIEEWVGAIIAGHEDAFTGVFDGNGHVISNISMHSPALLWEYGAGLFGTIGENGVVKNLGVENITITGYYRRRGAIAGTLENGEIVRCYSTGTLTNPLTNYDDRTGGLVGEIRGGLVRNCYSSCNLGGEMMTGGICGYSLEGQFQNVFYSGILSGDKCKGFIGSYAYTSFLNCLWDAEIDGLAVTSPGDSNFGAIGKSTAEMQTVNTFTDAGWDFVGESVNGGLDVWRLCVDGSGYPRLAWEYSRFGDFVCGDGVDGDDLLKLVGEWLNTGEGVADCNFDGIVDVLDFGILAGNWLD